MSVISTMIYLFFFFFLAKIAEIASYKKEEEKQKAAELLNANKCKSPFSSNAEDQVLEKERGNQNAARLLCLSHGESAQFFCFSSM